MDRLAADLGLHGRQDRLALCVFSCALRYRYHPATR